MKSPPPFFRDPAFRDAWLWCLPALILGLALRAALEWAMPYGYIQYDSADFLVTPYRWLLDHHYVIHSKKAFLSPTFFTLPFLLHVPALVFIPLAQHVAGLLEVFCAGALVRLWFPFWRWIIVPATALIAASPWQLWYEHTLMGEANYVFFLFLVALLGTLWARRPTAWNFAAFLLALFLLCGTRAEGKIVLLFGLALIPLVLWPRWKPVLICGLCLVLAFLLAGRGGGGGSHAFSLLYTTLFPLTPDDIRSEPGIAPYLLPLRDRTIQGGADSADLVRLAKDINDALKKYLDEQRGINRKRRKPLAEIEKHLALEILERRPLAVLLLPLWKFQLASDGWTSGSGFDERALHEKQAQAVTRGRNMMPFLSQGLTGQALDAAGLSTFVRERYDPQRLRWFDAYQSAWSAAGIALRLPDRPAAQPRWAHDFISDIPHPEQVVPGVPLYFLLAFAGMLAACAWPGAVPVGAGRVDRRHARHLVCGHDGGRDQPPLPVCLRAILLFVRRGCRCLGGRRLCAARGPPAGAFPMYCVVGSGPASMAAVLALVARGLRVTILDAGKTLEPERQAVLARLAGQAPEEWAPADLDRLRGGGQSDRHGSIHSKQTYGSDYPYEDVAEPLQEDRARSPFNYSMARGGLSNVWGASLLPAHADDLQDWPVGLAELEEHYRAVMASIPSSAVRDELEELLPTYGAGPGRPLEPSRQIADFLGDLRQRREALQKAGLYFGRARVAVENSAEKACVYCGLCLYGCPYSLIYSSAQTLERLRAGGRVEYRPGVIVEKLAPMAGGVRVQARDAEGREISLEAERVFVGAGVLPSAWLALHSLQAFDEPVTMLDSQYFIFPFFRFRRTPGVRREKLYSLVQAFLEMRDPRVSEHLVHVEVFSYSDFLERALMATPLRFLLWNSWMRAQLFDRLLVLQCFLHSRRFLAPHPAPPEERRRAPEAGGGVRCAESRIPKGREDWVQAGGAGAQAARRAGGAGDAIRGAGAQLPFRRHLSRCAARRGGSRPTSWANCRTCPASILWMHRFSPASPPPPSPLP